MGFTSGIHFGGTDSRHSVELQVNGHARSLQLHDRPGNDALENKGDLWTYSISSFKFPESCVTVEEINKVSIIETIVTIVQDESDGYQLLTRDFDVNRWIDGDGPTSHRQFELTPNYYI